MNSHPSELLPDHLPEAGNIDPEIVLERLLADPEVVQHIIRKRGKEVETVTGYYRCSFAQGQQRFVLHVPFSPAMVTEPNVEALATEHPDVRIRITERRKFGARLEIILPFPVKVVTHLLVEVIATSEV